MRLADLGLQAVLGQRAVDPRDQIAAIGLVVGMLELAAAAFGKVTAWRHLVVRPGRERAVVEQRVARARRTATWRPLAVTPSPRAAMRTIGSLIKQRERRGNGCDEIVGDHRRARRSPRRGRAARPPAQAASNARKPPRPQRGDHPGEHIAGPGARQPGRRRRREAEPAVGRRDERVRPLVDDHRAATAAPPRAPARPCCPPARRTVARTRPRAA